MQLDPMRLLVSSAGFVYDWKVTRKWRRILLYLLPAIMLGCLALAVAAGSWLDRGLLAQRYVEIGNVQFADWEQAWAPAAGDGSVLGTKATSEVFSVDSAREGSALNTVEVKVSPFAEALFRRVQLLSPCDRSQFVIATTLAQRGALEQAKRMLAKIAPASGHGYVPAHAMLAQLLTYELQAQPAPPNRELAEELMHHADESKRWERVPRSVLLAASDLNAMFGNLPAALELLTIAAQRHAGDNFALARLAQHMNNDRVFNDARDKAEESLKTALSADENDTAARVRLAQLYAMGGDFDRAEHVVQAIPEHDRPSELQRVLSNIYLARYDSSLEMKDNQISVNSNLLDAALRADPTNPLIAQAVAKLVRLQGPRPSEALIAHLLEQLAAGSATAFTHVYISELYLARMDFAKAIPHLEQAVKRLPKASECLNNLAYCLAELHPERCEEALAYSLRAIELSKQTPRSDYYDTLSYVFSRLDRHLEAVTAIENAIQLDPNRHEYHARAAAEYRHLDNESLAIVHEGLAKRLQETPSEAQGPQRAARSNPDSETKP